MFTDDTRWTAQRSCGSTSAQGWCFVTHSFWCRWFGYRIRCWHDFDFEQVRVSNIALENVAKRIEVCGIYACSYVFAAAGCTLASHARNDDLALSRNSNATRHRHTALSAILPVKAPSCNEKYWRVMANNHCEYRGFCYFTGVLNRVYRPCPSVVKPASHFGRLKRLRSARLWTFTSSCSSASALSTVWMKLQQLDAMPPSAITVSRSALSSVTASTSP